MHLKNVWLTYKTSYQFRYSIICSSPTRPPYSGVSLHHLANNNSGFHCSISALYFYYLRPRQLFSISFFFPSHFREEIRASCRHHCHTCAIIEHNSRSSLFPLYPHPSSLCTILNQINNQISLQFCTLIELLNSIAILYKHSNAILIYWCVIILVIASFTLNTGNIRIQMDRPFGSTSFTFLVEDMGATKSIKKWLLFMRFIILFRSNSSTLLLFVCFVSDI